jgi:transcriptional regulator with PAS, ATPase and Fis domain
MVEAVPDIMAEGVVVLDAAHTVIWMNRAFENFFGVRRIEHMGVDYRQLVRDKLLGVLVNADEFLARALAVRSDDRAVVSYSCHVRKSPSREERWLECTSNPLESGLYVGGRIERFADITHYRLAEGLLRQLSSRVRQTKTLESERSSTDPAIRHALDGISSIVDELRALISPPYSYGRKRKP